MHPILANLINDLGNSPAAMYPRVIVAALIATGTVLFLHLLVALVRGHRPTRPRWNILARLIYLGAIISVAILGVTSFVSVIAQGSMHGWFLFAHLFGAGAFVVFFFLIAVMWANASRLCTGPCTKSADAEDDEPAAAKFHGLTRLAFWLILISGVVTAGTMLISMLPVLGTQEMNQWMTVHRYAGLVLVVATIVHLYTVVLTKLRRL